MITTVKGKNQITIPAILARKLNIHAGRRIEWTIGGEGALIGRLLPTRAEIARQAAGMGRVWLVDGVDPVADLIAERVGSKKA